MRFRFLPLLVAIPLILGAAAEAQLRPGSDNPAHWEFDGAPVLLLGGSKTDHLFLLDDLDAHLDEMVQAGVNYARCVMSQREDADLKPHLRLPGGRFDLEQWNPEYWRRFDHCLKRSQALGIVLQIELWDRFDYSQAQWRDSAWRPVNNVNYGTDDSGLANAYPAPAWRDKQPFFHTLPGTPRYDARLASVRPYQVRFVDKVLEHSLGYHHVLYCIGNESSAPLAWTLHWTDRLRDRAREAGETVLVTAMLAGGRLQPVLQRPARFGYIEACKLLGPRRQSWAPRGAQQFDRIAETVRAASEEGRPVNAVKIICNVDDEVDAYSVRKFWRGLMAGLGAVRFHRPPAGSGLNQAATNAIAAARLANERVPFHLSRARPDLLSNCEPDEAYVRAAPRRGYLVYFPRGGAVSLDPGAGEDIHHGAWLDIAAGRVRSEFDVTGEGPAELRTPSDGPWAAVAQVRARYSMGPANAALPGRNTCVSR